MFTILLEHASRDPPRHGRGEGSKAIDKETKERQRKVVTNNNLFCSGQKLPGLKEFVACQTGVAPL
jgi:hypothetical protein